MFKKNVVIRHVPLPTVEPSPVDKKEIVVKHVPPSFIHDFEVLSHLQYLSYFELHARLLFHFLFFCLGATLLLGQHLLVDAVDVVKFSS